MKVVDRDKVLFEGDIVSLTSYNSKGKFDVLNHHTNFISLVEKKLEIVLSNGESKEIPLNDGVLKVESNIISVYLGVKF